MNLKIKTKVALGILFLFIEFLIIGGLSINYFSEIKNSAELMIKNNYQSVIYSENMIQALDEIQLATNTKFLNEMYHFDKNSLEVSINKFEENLKMEEANITEHGEKELAQLINQKYFRYKAIVLNQKIDSISDKVNYYFVNISPLQNEIKTNIFSISNLNMQAIKQKNENTNQMIKRVYKNLCVALTFCFMITFSFMYNFPNYIAQPIKEITEKIKQFANRKFNSHINFSSKDEFQQLTEAFSYIELILEENLKPVVVMPEKIREVSSFNEIQVLQNIQSLLASSAVLTDLISKSENNEILKKQSEIIQDVVEEFRKIVNE